jgi:hypothetical protein
MTARGGVGRERQRDMHGGGRSEVGSLNAVEGDHRQSHPVGQAVDFWGACKRRQDDHVGRGRIIGTRQAGHPQLAVQLHSVLMPPGDYQRALAALSDAGGDAVRYDRVTRDESEHGAVMLRGIVASGFVVSRHGGRGGERCDERQAGRRRDLDGLGNVCGTDRADQRDRQLILGGRRRGSHGIRIAMTDMADIG